ncbi:MAG: DUF6262 family protein [Actinomycetota bacterium]|nr:DUF6262 family protein [Actinomycetota bacterium]
MTGTEHTDRAAAMVSAQKHRSEATRRRSIEALRPLHDAGGEVSFAALAREAGVSRAWLYRDPQLRAEIERMKNASHRRPARAPNKTPRGERASDESLRELRAALQSELVALREENHRLREALARQLGERRAGAPTASV